jgi:hypothetical protein
MRFIHPAVLRFAAVLGWSEFIAGVPKCTEAVAWTAAGVGIAQTQPNSIPTRGLNTSRAIAEHTDRHARRGLGMVGAHGFFNEFLFFFLVNL